MPVVFDNTDRVMGYGQKFYDQTCPISVQVNFSQFFYSLHFAIVQLTIAYFSFILILYPNLMKTTLANQKQLPTNGKSLTQLTKFLVGLLFRLPMLSAGGTIRCTLPMLTRVTSSLLPMLKVKLTGSKEEQRNTCFTVDIWVMKSTDLLLIFGKRDPNSLSRMQLKACCPKINLQPHAEKLKVYRGSDHPHEAQTTPLISEFMSAKAKPSVFFATGRLRLVPPEFELRGLGIFYYQQS